MTTKKPPPDGDDLADLSNVLPPVPPTPKPERLVSTESGLVVLAAGGTMEDALAEDDEQNARCAARLAAEATELQDRAERRRLDLIERRLRVEDRLRRRRAREAREQGDGTP